MMHIITIAGIAATFVSVPTAAIRAALKGNR